MKTWCRNKRHVAECKKVIMENFADRVKAAIIKHKEIMFDDYGEQPCDAIDSGWLIEQIGIIEEELKNAKSKTN